MLIRRMHSAESVPISVAIFGHALSDITCSVISNRTEAGRWRLTDDELAPQLWWVLAATIVIMWTDNYKHAHGSRLRDYSHFLGLDTF
jgi:hypothetical protein